MVLAAIVGLGAGLGRTGRRRPLGARGAQRPLLLRRRAGRLARRAAGRAADPDSRHRRSCSSGPSPTSWRRAGAAGGVAGIFNAPIAGVFFALEVLLRRFGTRNFSVIVLSSLVATVTAIQLRGDAIPVVTHHGLNSAAGRALRGWGCWGCSAVWRSSASSTVDRGRVRAADARPGVAAAGDRRGARRRPRPLRREHPRPSRERARRDAALLGEGAVGAMLLLVVLKMAATSMLLLVQC